MRDIVWRMKKTFRPEQRFVALIRGINVGGKNIVRMEALRAACKRLGLRDIATFIQSGNVVFESDSCDSESLGRLFETMLEKEFSVKTCVVVIPAAVYRGIIAHIPSVFSDDRWKHNIFFFRSEKDAQDFVREFSDDPQSLRVSSFHCAVFWSQPRELAGKEKHTRKLFAHASYKTLTIRNDRTTRKLVDMLD